MRGSRRVPPPHPPPIYIIHAQNDPIVVLTSSWPTSKSGNVIRKSREYKGKELKDVNQYLALR